MHFTDKYQRQIITHAKVTWGVEYQKSRTATNENISPCFSVFNSINSIVSEEPAEEDKKVTITLNST
jgi:hypothetical protein